MKSDEHGEVSCEREVVTVTTVECLLRFPKIVNQYFGQAQERINRILEIVKGEKLAKSGPKPKSKGQQAGAVCFRSTVIPKMVSRVN